MRIIDAKSNEAIESIKEEVENKQQSQGEYSVDDFALVRTTDFLDESHNLRPTCEIPFVTTVYNAPYMAMFRIIREKYNINPFDEEQQERLKELTSMYSPLSSQYRSTIHFCLNGLVSNNGNGLFDGRSFIIIDRLNKHLGVDNINSIRMEDTYIKGSFKLSDESTILINKDKYDELIELYPWLTTYNIVLFEGDEKLAVQKILLDMGITPENIEEHSAEYTERTPLYEECIDSIAATYDISRSPHKNSSDYIQDDAKNIPLWKQYDLLFYKELFNQFDLDSVLFEYLTTSTDSVFAKADAMERIIKEVGFDSYVEFVTAFNNRIKEQVLNGIFPSNNQILNDGKIIIKDNDKTM